MKEELMWRKALDVRRLDKPFAFSRKIVLMEVRQGSVGLGIERNPLSVDVLLSDA